MEVKIPELGMILENQKKMMKRIAELENRLVPEWCTLSEAAKLKGLSYETLKKHVEWQPDPVEAKLVNGKRRWHRDVILAWLTMDDKQLESGYRELKAVS